MPTPDDLYFAFASGGIGYDCEPCGRCCKGLGFATGLVQIAGSRELMRLGPYLDASGSGRDLAAIHTYADGCRHLGEKHICELHRDGGREAKPLICRLFPFSRLVDLEGLWTLLPHARCPWTAADGTSPLSQHAEVIRDLVDAQGALHAWMAPERMPVLTSLAPAARRRLEESIRDEVFAHDPDGTAAAPLAAAAALQEKAIGAPWPLPEDGELWFDLLRSAGEPAPLTEKTERTLLAALPALRVQLMVELPLPALPAALGAFVLWLRTLGELGPRDLSGEDLLLLLDRALPLVKMLALAESRIPALDEQPPHPSLAEIWEELTELVGEPLGTSLLKVLRPHQAGALGALMQLGAAWPRVS